MLLSKQAALAEQERRRKQEVAFVLEDFLFPEQLAFVQDESPFKTAVCSRRSGKTIACAADLCKTASVTPGVVCLYITLSRNNAKKLIWPELKKLNRRFKLGGVANESDLSLTFPGDSIIYCSGAGDKSEIEKFRGLPIKKAYIDESQSFPQFIKDLINDVISPALLDYAGTLSLIGTPGAIPSGYYYDCTHSGEWSHHAWTFFNNPFIIQKSGKTHQELLDREIKRRGVSIDHPSIQREFFGKWSLDSDSLVYSYDANINHYQGLERGNYQYILGIDIGYNDADALAVLAYSSGGKETYLVEEVITRRQGMDELVEQIASLQKKYDISKIVMDTGGLGKKIQESIISRYQIPVQSAEKVRKFEYIELMNAAMRTGSFKAKSGSRFAQDCMLVEYDLDKSTPDKRVVSKRYHSDICDAVLYAWRESYSYTFSPTPAPLKYGTPEWQKKEQEGMFDAAIDHFTELAERNKGPFGGFDEF